MQSKFLSIVVPVFNEEESLNTLHKEVVAALSQIECTYEILFIDDASTDNSQQSIRELIQKDTHVRGFKLNRNSQKAGALVLGFQQAKGNIVISIDADLQDDPTEIPRLIQEIEDGADVVNGWKKKRHDPLSKRIPSLIVNKITCLITGKYLHDMNSGFKAYNSTVLQDLVIPGSLYRFIPHLLHVRGYDVREIPVNHRERQYGKSKFGLPHRLRSLFDLLTVLFLVRFSNRPMHFFGFVGGLVFLAGFAAGLHLTYLWFNGIGIGGRPLLMLSVLLMVVGFQIISVGLLGEMFVSLKHSNTSRIPHSEIC